MLKQAKVTLVRWRLGRSVGIDQEAVHDVGPGVDPDRAAGRQFRPDPHPRRVADRV